ncbi:LacI family DNA-binding transcriptional regulator [Sphingobium limneticum]|uniref:LacI family transcriptional regulator n=1 Tax=Sphingobium limneticum TaxID=1007511 RepID=A0A5J5I502_9SPHN|nr:substrate-binding domain-containing protein [Sphingobium limneticum]KAA9018773.1 LacI family transcriptional regulator [Sphingobium limneticum]KAA9031345.1 LacI family transcriptional regulator [Sphingobium limneticum]
MDDQGSGPLKSIADLARLAGVSVSTVSRALTGKGALNKGTRARIQALADHHGFRMNVAAQNLRLGRTGAIAVLMPLGHARGQQLSDPFFLTMLGYLADALTDRGYDLLLSRVLPDRDDWLDTFIRTGRTDGVIVIGQSDQGAALARAAASYRPLVVWGEQVRGDGPVTVGTDNEAGGRLAAQHLVDRGRRTLAFFGDVGVPEFAARHVGFLAGLPPELRDDVVLVTSPVTSEASEATARDWFAAGNRPDGIFAASDVVALSLIAAAQQQGLQVPQDISIVGFDDIPLARLTRPALSTIRQDIEMGAHHLVDLLVRRIGGEDAGSVQIAPELLVRESS